MMDESRVSDAENEVKGALVDVTELARLTGYDRGTIKNWIDRDEMPVVSGGTNGRPYVISVRAFVEWRAKVAADALRKKLPASDFEGFMGIVDPTKAFAAKMKFMAAEREAKNLVPRHFITDVMARAANAQRTAIMSIPDRLYREKSGFPPELTGKWREEAQKVCRSALETAVQMVGKAIEDMKDPDDDLDDEV